MRSVSGLERRRDCSGFVDGCAKVGDLGQLARTRPESGLSSGGAR